MPWRRVHYVFECEPHDRLKSESLFCAYFGSVWPTQKPNGFRTKKSCKIHEIDKNATTLSRTRNEAQVHRLPIIIVISTSNLIALQPQNCFFFSNEQRCSQRLRILSSMEPCLLSKKHRGSFPGLQSQKYASLSVFLTNAHFSSTGWFPLPPLLLPCDGFCGHFLAQCPTLPHRLDFVLSFNSSTSAREFRVTGVAADFDGFPNPRRSLSFEISCRFCFHAANTSRTSSSSRTKSLSSSSLRNFSTSSRPSMLVSYQSPPPPFQAAFLTQTLRELFEMCFGTRYSGKHDLKAGAIDAISYLPPVRPNTTAR